MARKPTKNSRKIFLDMQAQAREASKQIDDLYSTFNKDMLENYPRISMRGVHKALAQKGKISGRTSSILLQEYNYTVGQRLKVARESRIYYVPEVDGKYVSSSVDMFSVFGDYSSKLYSKTITNAELQNMTMLTKSVSRDAFANLICDAFHEKDILSKIIDEKRLQSLDLDNLGDEYYPTRLTGGAVQAWELGRAEIPSYVVAILEYYGLSSRWLLTGEGELWAGTALDNVTGKRIYSISEWGKRCESQFQWLNKQGLLFLIHNSLYTHPVYGGDDE